MRFADLSPGLANAIEKLGGDVETVLSAASSARASSDGASTETAPAPSVGVDDLVSLFTTADEAEAQRNKAEDENVARFLRGREEDAPEKPRKRPPAPERPKNDKEERRFFAKRLGLATPKKKGASKSTTTNAASDAQTPAEEQPPRRDVELRMTEDPRATNKPRERAPAKKRERAAQETSAEQPESKSSPKNAGRDSARARAARQEQTLRQHIETSQLRSMHKEGRRRAANRAERRHADQKAASKKAAAQLEAKPRETQQQDRERALAWAEGFEAFENLHAKGGHGWADFIFGSEELEDDRLGLIEADLLNDGLRCKGTVEDGSRCLRRPPEGEMYCREHRMSI